MSIFNFFDYKLYLNERIAQMPKKGRGQVLAIATALKIHSTLVSQILRGPKHFTLEQAEALARYFGLMELEADYFLTLLQIERAGTKDLRGYFKAKLEKLKRDSLQLANRVVRDRELSEAEKARFYSDWIYSGVRLLCAIEEFATIDALAEHLNLPRAKVSEVAEFLLSTGLILEENGRYKVGAQRTYLEASSPYVRQHHTNWRLRAVDRATRLTSEELMFTSPVALDERDFNLFREELADLVKRFYARVKDSPSQKLACLNIDWFYV